MGEQTPLGRVVRKFTCPGLAIEQPDSLVACYRAGHECRNTWEELKDEYGVTQRSFCGCCGEQYGSTGVPRQLLAEWQAAERDEFPRVQGECPSCGVGPLFLAEGGYVTCSWVDCKEPSAASELLHGVLPGEPIPEWERELLSQPRPEQPDRPAPVKPSEVRVGDVVEVTYEGWVDEDGWVRSHKDDSALLAPIDSQAHEKTVRILRRAEPEQVGQLHDLICAASGMGTDDALPMAHYLAGHNVRVVNTDDR